MKSLDKLAIGASAVGTGQNTPRKIWTKTDLGNFKVEWSSLYNGSKQNAAHASLGAIINSRPEIKYKYNAFISDGNSYSELPSCLHTQFQLGEQSDECFSLIVEY